MGNVGTTKIFENDKIVIWEFTLEPGERTPCHTHASFQPWLTLRGSGSRKPSGGSTSSSRARCAGFLHPR